MNWCKHNKNLAGVYNRCYICEPKGNMSWRIEGNYKWGGTLVREVTEIANALKEIEHLFTIPDLCSITCKEIEVLLPRGEE